MFQLQPFLEPFQQEILNTLFLENGSKKKTLKVLCLPKRLFSPELVSLLNASGHEITLLDVVSTKESLTPAIGTFDVVIDMFTGRFVEDPRAYFDFIMKRIKRSGTYIGFYPLGVVNMGLFTVHPGALHQALVYSGGTKRTLDILSLSGGEGDVVNLQRFRLGGDLMGVFEYQGLDTSVMMATYTKVDKSSGINSIIEPFGSIQ